MKRNAVAPETLREARLMIVAMPDLQAVPIAERLSRRALGVMRVSRTLFEVLLDEALFVVPRLLAGLGWLLAHGWRAGQKIARFFPLEFWVGAFSFLGAAVLLMM